MDENGFVKLSDFLTQEEADQIVEWADDLNHIEETSGKWMIYFESNGNRSRIENFLPFKPALRKFVEKKMQPLLEETIKQKVCLFKEKMNWKHAHGKGFAAHQDHPAWSDFTPSKYYTVALFGDNTTLENGCLEFVENKNGSLLPYDKEGNGGIINSDELDWKPITTTPRDILIFDSFAPHRSGDNKTDGSRRIFYFTYNLELEGCNYKDYITQKREHLPPRIERQEGKVYNTLGNKYNLANPIM